MSLADMRLVGGDEFDDLIGQFICVIMVNQLDGMGFCLPVFVLNLILCKKWPNSYSIDSVLLDKQVLMYKVVQRINCINELIVLMD